MQIYLFYQCKMTEKIWDKSPNMIIRVGYRCIRNNDVTLIQYGARYF